MCEGEGCACEGCGGEGCGGIDACLLACLCCCSNEPVVYNTRAETKPKAPTPPTPPLVMLRNDNGYQTL